MVPDIYQSLFNGLRIPAFGYGTYLAEDPKQLETALNAALENGYRHIDTASAYKNEAVIGKVLKQWLASGKVERKELFITTKLPPWGTHPDRVETFFNKSLENLGLDYIDLYLIHFPVGMKYVGGTDGIEVNANTEIEPKTDHEAIWKRMESLVDTGKVKSIGLSNFSQKQIEAILKYARILPANLQIELHLYLQQPQLVEFCKQNKITVVAYCPLGNPGRNESNPDWKNIMDDPLVTKLAAKYKKTEAQILLKFLVEIGVIPIPKSVTIQRIKENSDIFDFNLTVDELNKLRQTDQGEKRRNVTFKVFKGIENAAEYPFPK